MVSTALQAAIQAMGLDERLELVEYIENSVESTLVEATQDEQAIIESRAAELHAEPSIGMTWDELKSRLAAREA